MTVIEDQPAAARERTRSDLYRLIRASGGELTRTALIEATGLSRSTVNHAVTRLLDEGRVDEIAAEAKGRGSGSGRPAATLRARASGEYLAGIDFGHSHVHVAIADALGVELDREEEIADVDLDCRGAMQIAARALSRLMIRNDIGEVALIVAGVPGPIDIATGLVRSPTILSSWVGISPAQELERLTGFPVRVENDALLGAIGELHSGAGRRYDNFVYIKASHGVGAGLILNRRPFRGATGLAGEIGHTHLAGETELCRCGNRGCLEAVISVTSIHNQISHTHPTLYGRELDRVPVDDGVTQRILEQAGRTIGRVLVDFANLLNPDAFVLGGELSRMGASVAAGIRAELDRHAQPATAAALEVAMADLGTDAELTGALRLAADFALA